VLRKILEMKPPAASSVVSQNQNLELPQIFLRLHLPLHMSFDGLPVFPFPYCGYIVPVSPNVPAPQDSLHRRLSEKDLPRRDALEYLHNQAWSHIRMRTADQMNVILIRPNRFHLDRKPIRDLGSRLLQNRRAHLIQALIFGISRERQCGNGFATHSALRQATGNHKLVE
jgi:hypothetical protein